MNLLHKARLLRKIRWIWFFYCQVILVCFSGCQRYQPKPLDNIAVERALEVPSEQILKIKAESLSHLIIPPLTINLSDGLSPEEAAVLAVLVNPSLRTVRDKRGIADAQLLEAGLLPNPQLSYRYDFPTGGTTEGTVNGFGLGLGWDVEELISRSARIEAAKKNKLSIDLGLAWQEWQTAEAAKMAAYDLFSLNNQVGLAIESDQRLAENLNVVRQSVQTALMTELELSAAETASHQAHSAVLELQRQVLEQRFKLNLLLGLPADTNAILQPGIELPSYIEMPIAGKLVDGLEKRRLDLVALRFGYQSQENVVRAAILDQFPRINIGFNQERDTGNVVTSGFAISVDLPIFNLNKGQIAIERATRQELFDEYVNRVFEARSEIAQLTANIPLIINQIQTAEAAAASGRTLVETYRTAVEEKQADVISYYIAWNDLTQRRIDVIKLKQQLMDTCIVLELATGLYSLNEVKIPAGNSIGAVNNERPK